jgi:RimJ/RimL family protein N-acetyltransferase
MQDDPLAPLQPDISTERLVLRPMNLDDGPTIHRLVNDKDITYNCVHIPYPYPEGAAEAWIVDHPFRFVSGQAAIFAITKDGDIIGACGIEYKPSEKRFELGYWIGKAFWGNGYATEAVQRLLDFGLDELNIAEIYAECLSSNTISCNVLEKIGMQHIARVSKPCHSPYKEEDVEVYYACKKSKLAKL